MKRNVIHTGDCFDVLPELNAESVHAVVTDPPYGLAFMGRDWDDFEPKEYQEWSERWARECKRVLKPGGHLLAFRATGRITAYSWASKTRGLRFGTR